MRRSDQRLRYDELLAVIRGIRRRWRFRILIKGLAITAAAAIVALLGAGLLVEGLDPSARVMTWVRLGLGIVVAATALWFLVRPLLRRVSDEAVALYLEEHEPSLEAAVLSALEARADEPDADDASAKPASGISDALLIRTLEDAVRRVHAIDDGRWIERSGLIRVTAALAAVLLAGAVVGVLGPLPARQGAVSLFSSPAPAEAAGPVTVTVTPGDATISRGADVSIAAQLRGFDTDLVELGVRSAGDTAFDRLPMAAGADGRFGYLLFDLDAETEYFVEAGGVRSDVFTLTVADLPYVQRLDLTLVYPSYTGLASETIADGGDVTALRGTTVRVTATPTLPVDGGAIIVDGRDPVAMTVDSATGELTGSFRIRADGFYHIVLDGPAGESVEASPRYVIDALSDGAPIVAFEEPGRDTRATSIDELYVEARAEDDYGVGAMTLHYRVNGGAEETVDLYGGRGGLKEVTAGHTFYLEEYGLEPGDLVSYWATAQDNDTVDGTKDATSDIYFIQVRPFSRDYSAAESRGMPQGGGQQQGPDGDLSERQRQIIAGTFNLIRDSAMYSTAEYRENINTLALSQERLREQTRTLAERMVARQVTADTSFQRIAEILPQAAEAMDSAATRLRDQAPGSALPPEQRALQQLQRAEAIFREVQVSMGQPQGGAQGGGGSPNAEDLADLFELELDKLQDQYETVDRGGQSPTDPEAGSVDETAERLEELARRQLQEAERQRREAASGRGTAGGDAQRQLAEQVEEEARRLERLSREQQRPELQDAAQRLREAAESMRRSASGSASQGEQAAEQLREARRLLQRSQDQQLRRRADAVRQEAQRLAEEQRQIREDAEGLLGTEPGAERTEQAQRLQVQKQLQQNDVAALEQDLRELAGEAGSEQPEVGRRLRDAAGEITDSRLEEKIEFSRQITQGGAPDDYVRDLEEQIQRDLENVRDRLDGVQEAFREREDETGAQRALEQAGDLARGLESMRQRGEEAREMAPGSPQGGGGFPPDAVRQGRAEAGRRLEDAMELRDRLRAEGMGTDEVDDLIGGLQDLTNADNYGNADDLARLQAALADQAKRLELVLRIALVGEEQLRLFLDGDADIDPEYRDLVEEYYRTLSRESDGR
jgi:hypothetical protein